MLFLASLADFLPQTSGDAEHDKRMNTWLRVAQDTVVKVFFAVSSSILCWNGWIQHAETPWWRGPGQPRKPMKPTHQHAETFSITSTSSTTTATTTKTTLVLCVNGIPSGTGVEASNCFELHLWLHWAAALALTYNIFDAQFLHSPATTLGLGMLWRMGLQWGTTVRVVMPRASPPSSRLHTNMSVSWRE